MARIVGINGIRQKYPFITSLAGILTLYILVLLLRIIIQHASTNTKIEIPSGNLPYSGINTLKEKLLPEFIVSENIRQDDTRLIQLIHEGGYLKPPAGLSVPYNLTNPTEDPSLGQSAIIKKIFKNKINGFFVESGALDGETRSNTLSLEKDLGWKGLLIEPDPINFAALLGKNRKAWVSPTCLSLHPYPHKAMLFLNYSTSKIIVDYEDPKLLSKSDDKNKNKTKVVDKSKILLLPPTATVQCLPLFSLLLALNITTVHYFSLDVEGGEIDVLKTIPFDLISIQVLSVEITHGIYRRKTASYLKRLMATKGYVCVTRVMHPNSYANDLIFAQKTLKIDARFAPEILHWNSTLTFDIIDNDYIPH